MTTLNTEQDLQAATAKLKALMNKDPAAGSSEACQIDTLATQIEQYENIHYHLEKPTAIEAIKFRMDQQGLTHEDMIPYFGSLQKVYQVLNDNQPLDQTIADKLHKELGIPAKILNADVQRTCRQ